MIERYAHPEMTAIWSDQKKYETWLKVELSACEALVKAGEMPQSALDTIREKAEIDPARIDALEKVVKHDVIAFLTSVTEKVGEAGRFIHLGMTSSDVLDTALALLIREAADRLIEDLENLLEALKTQALKHKKTLMIGRSHGIHGEPITFGLKLCHWYEETRRNLQRLTEAKKIISVGKISGAMGTYAHISPEIEAYVCESLGLTPEPVSSQIVHRDRHAQFMQALALIASSLERFSVEIRHLQRTEVGEAEEPFEAGQKGSSAMPHKRNPVSTENISGLARVIRAHASAALENIPLWHERDISHSSVERLILPDSTVLLDYMLKRFTNMIRRIVVYPERMRKNMEMTGGTLYSQKILLRLIQKGMIRETAYEVVQKTAMEIFKNGGSFQAAISANASVAKHLTPNEVAACFDPWQYLQQLDVSYERVFGKDEEK
ncbi:MAG: adenylosuccinate lyase [Nitrospiria bacterium]